jgi:DNA repair protein SbcD/Mre11
VIVAHLSDLHLGFRAYGRVESGTDIRERDVTAAFERAIQEIVRIRPEVVVVAGDVFDRPTPPAGAVVALARGLEGLRSSLPETLVLMVAGPRDTPRRPGDPGALAVLDTFPNVEAATGLTRSILMDRLDLHACLVPYRAASRHPPALPEPDPRRRWNLLVLHGAMRSAGEAGVHVDPAEWDYVALGGEHRRRSFGPHAAFSGSLERVALDPWDEAADEKGFLTVDLDSGVSSFHAIPGRAVVALAPVKVPSGDPEGLRRRVREITGEVPGGITGKIVRLRLEGASPTDLLALQGAPLSELRQAALHLAVEAGKDVRVTAPTPSAAAAQLLREAVEAELARDGLLDDTAAGMAGALIDDQLEEPFGSESIGDIDALDGDLRGVGRVSTSISRGLTAVIGGLGRERRAVAELFVREGGGSGPDPIRWLWSGVEAESLDDAVRRAVRAVAQLRGFGIVEAALERAGEAGDEPGLDRRSGRTDSDPSRSSRGAVRVDPQQVSSECRSAQRELRAVRADVAEVDGDLEVATMDWLRERQDAETTLQAYRDRARDLRARIRRMEAAGPDAPCPTCGRVLESHYEEVLTELRNEWEGVVQDGSWWRSRWEQLELKPPHLQELEGQSLRLHAALEAGSERVELLRARLAELGDEVGVGPEAGAEPGALGAVVGALRRVGAARQARARDLLLDRASRFLCRISGGRVLAVRWVDGRTVLEGFRGQLRPLSEEDSAAARVAVRLAAASLVAAGGRVLGSLVLEEPFDRLDAEAGIRTLVLTKQLLREIPRVILFSRGEAVDARPELFDSVLEVREEGASGGPALRPALAGPGVVVLKAPVRPAKSQR